MTIPVETVLTTEQRLKLHELEMAIIRYIGAPGPWLTEAWDAKRQSLVAALYDEEKRLGVHNPRNNNNNNKLPRWTKP
jgi:hypothetical protein